jgi:hypothetical protein
MNSTNTNTESRLEALLLGGVEPHEMATGGGLALRVISASLNPTERVSSVALSVGNATAETVVSKSTHRKLAPDGVRRSHGNGRQVVG